MIALASDCLLFRLDSGECVPLSADALSVELIGHSAKIFDPEFLYNAAKAVFYYFQHELGRDTVTPEEFTEALEKALTGFKTSLVPAPKPPAAGVVESDLRRIATEAAGGCELFFFPRLREELRVQLRREPRLLRFHGLRGCAMTLAGARRWSGRCRTVSERIVGFLRGCANVEAGLREFSLLIE